MNEIALEIRALNKSFKHNDVLVMLNLTVFKGEIILIEGGNGSGKSTMLKIIAGLMDCDSGVVNVAENTKIGALIENPSFIENETLEYNMRFLIELTGTYDKSSIIKFFDLLALDIDESKSVKKFSVGMRQKAGIIQAVFENQNLILFDEPTRGLDKESTHAFGNLIKAIRKEEKTVIVCAHDGVSHIHFDRYFILKAGELNETKARKI